VRTFILLVVIALLPVRMWAADGMAVRMAQEQAASAAMSAAHDMPADCPMMAKAAGETSSHHEPASASPCMSCFLCAAAAWLAAPLVPTGSLPSAPPGTTQVRFVSTDLAPDLRPPIA